MSGPSSQARPTQPSARKIAASDSGVVREDEAEERGQAQLGRARDRLLHEAARDPVPLLRGVDIDADLGGGGVRGPAIELAEAEPAQHLTALFPHPQGMAIRQAVRK